MEKDTMGKWINFGELFEVFPINECPELSNCVYVFISRRNISPIHYISYGEVENKPQSTKDFIPNTNFNYPITHIAIYKIISEDERKEIITQLKNSNIRWVM